MPEPPKTFYLTTPIYYVNARPHIGHAYSTIAADVLARRHRLLGDDTFFLTGTDEHGQKVQRSAEAAGIPPQQFTDEVSATFRSLWDRMGITYNDYIRTTEERHKRGVQKLWKVLEECGDIYLSSYTGQYCVSDEAFVDVPVGAPCPTCGRITETITEENYFFRLSKYQVRLLELIESGELHVQPETTRNEVLSFIRGSVSQVSQTNPAELAYTSRGIAYVPGALKDLSISRTTFDWGIPVPSSEGVILSGAKNPGISSEAPQRPAEKHVVYVWLDALANYITAIGYGSDDPVEQAKFEKYWPANVHLVGKEITRFHCVYWPAFLMAAGLPVPKSVVANGWLLFEESKMSKSRGNVVRTETILDAFGEHYRASLVKAGQPQPDKRDCDLFAADVLRYFLLREIPFGQDGSFSFDALLTRYNADLANGYGNLVSRTLAMIQKYFNGEVPDSPITRENADRDSILAGYGPEPPEEKEQGLMVHLPSEANALPPAFGWDMSRFRFARAFEAMWLFIGLVDSEITTQAPWKTVPGTSEEWMHEHRSRVLYLAAESLRIITALLYPVMPHTTAKVWAQLGLGSIEEAARNGELKNPQWGGLKPGTKLGPLAPIFPRADKGLAQMMTDMEQNLTTAPASGTEKASAEPAPLTESFNDVSPTANNEQRTTGNAPPVTGNLQPATPLAPEITIDDFAKVDLRVAKVLVAERIPKADKLLRLEVDLGFEKRQILAGIAEYYTPESLIGRNVVIVANLAPRKMRGLESNGMIVAASVGSDGAPVLASFTENVELGARLK